MNAIVHRYTRLFFREDFPAPFNLRKGLYPSVPFNSDTLRIFLRTRLLATNVTNANRCDATFSIVPCRKCARASHAVTKMTLLLRRLDLFESHKLIYPRWCLPVACGMHSAESNNSRVMILPNRPKYMNVYMLYKVSYRVILFTLW